MKAVLTFKSSLVVVIPTVQTLQKCRFGRKSDFLIQLSFHKTRCRPKIAFYFNFGWQKQFWQSNLVLNQTWVRNGLGLKIVGHFGPTWVQLRGPNCSETFPNATKTAEKSNSSFKSIINWLQNRPG